MVSFIRRFQRPLLTVVVILVILSFIVFFNMSSTRSGAFVTSNAVAKIYGRNVTDLDVKKEQYRFQVCSELQMGQMLFALGGREAAMAAYFGQDPSGSAMENFIWNAMVLRHEAAALGIVATEEEITKAIKELRPFQTNGTFNYNTYKMYLENRLSQRGMTQKDMEGVIADEIRLNKVRDLLSATVPPSPSEVREQYVERNQKTEVSFFRLKLEDFKAAVQVTDEDVAKLFEERKSTLKTPEKRKVKFVAFTLAAEQKPLNGPERARATQRLSEQATNFAVEMTQPNANFESAAAKLNLKVEETPLFSTDDPPAALGKSERAAEAAFHLTKQEPNSDVINADNGYYVLQLSGTEEARPLTLEEAKPKLTEQLKDDRAHEAMNLKASELRAKVDAELKAGKSFEDAAKTAGVTLEKVPAFSAAEQQRQDPTDTGDVKRRSADMKEGELSEFVQTNTGGVVVHLDKRLPIDEAAFAKEKAGVAENLMRMKGQMIFQDWLKERRAAAKVMTVGRQGSVAG